MRTRKLASILPILVASVAFAAGCAAPASEDDTEDQTQNVTGGSSAIESPVVFLFETAAKDASPKCAGAMLSDDFAVTAKACAKEGMIVGRAYDKDGRGKRARVGKLHAPSQADADIVVVELDRPLAGTNAVITHMPLRDRYAVNAFAATDGKGLFSPGKNEASTVSAAMTEENATHGTIIPIKGAEICDGDMGAPVCSSTGGKLAGFNLYGTCGLSGLVVGRAPVAEKPATPPAPGGTPATPPAAAPGAEPPPAANAPANPATSCSGGAWKVAQLGRYAEFLESFAPKAFQPLVIDKPILRNFPYVPDGLWGYKTKGDVKSCTLDAVTLAAIAPGKASATLSAKVSFAGMDKNAAPYGRFGLALKSKPTEMRWLPAKASGAAGGNAFDAKFEGVVSADLAGDYIVAFRASANGGETWTSCDTDGIANGFSVEKALALKIVDPNAPTTPTTPATPPSTTPKDTPPASSSDGYSDPPAGEGSSEEETAEEDAPKKKATDNQGCSMGAAAPWSTSSSLPIAGVLLGLVALSRRRRAK